ncbi:MAG: DUF2157 domain-containing protein [Burkholderiales bacterium]
MKRADLERAVRAGILSAEQAGRLMAFLQASAAETPRFSFVHVLYYLGGLIAIGAMSLFMTLGWNALGGWGGAFTAACYAVLALALTHWFLQRKGLQIPAGILATLAVTMVPLAIFGAQMALGYWGAATPFRHYHQFIDGRWLMMEFGTLAVAVVLLWRYRFPFMLMPVSVTLWYMSMDLGPLLVGSNWQDWDIRKLISLYFGILFVGLAFWVDIRSRRSSKDYAFWLYLFGVMTFWGGLSAMHSGSELGKLLYCLLNVGMIFAGALLGRRVFAVFGGFGVAGYLGYLASRVFQDSLLFPFALSLIGLAIIALGVKWQRHEAQWTTRLRSFLPAALRELLEARAP